MRSWFRLDSFVYAINNPQKKRFRLHKAEYCHKLFTVVCCIRICTKHFVLFKPSHWSNIVKPHPLASHTLITTASGSSSFDFLFSQYIKAQISYIRPASRFTLLPILCFRHVLRYTTKMKCVFLRYQNQKWRWHYILDSSQHIFYD